MLVQFTRTDGSKVAIDASRIIYAREEKTEDGRDAVRVKHAEGALSPEDVVTEPLDEIIVMVNRARK